MRASKYIPLPVTIQRKKAVINIRNSDEACFAWACTAAVTNPEGNVNRTSSYPNFNDVFDFTGITFPVSLNDISTFEVLNNVSINVYILDFDFKSNDYQVAGPVYYTKNKKIVHINLLLLTNQDGGTHYCYISNLSRLVSNQFSKRNGAVHICDGCLNFFRTAHQLEMHSKNDCTFVYSKLPTTNIIKDPSGIQIPENILKFTNYSKQLKLPFVVYGDFETLLKPLHYAEPDPNNKFTVKTCVHEPYSFSYYIKCSFDNSLSRLNFFRGENAAQSFISSLENNIRELYNQYLKHVVPMKPLTSDELTDFEKSDKCFICNKLFMPLEVKVKDHCHLTGNYRSAAHQQCNLNYKIPKFIPIFFHNLTGYDSHLFIKQLALSNEKIDVIAENKEKYISFTKHVFVGEVIEEDKKKKVYLQLRFLDSYKFLNRSLDVLSKNLTDDQCREVKKYFTGEKFNFIRQKGVFPYSYVDCFEKLEETSLPAHEDFYDKLKDENVSVEDYQRAQHVWSLFQCQTLGEYSDVYLKSDVLLLVDVFENFRTLCLDIYKLDPAQYFSLPGVSFDAMLKMTGVEIELLTDINMLHFFKKGIRGGVSMCSGRKALANNIFLENYNPSQPSSYIMYLDSTNLYGHSMSQYLPISGFRWLSEHEIQDFDLTELTETSETGYVFEVDLIYPYKLHDLHNDLPFCPENLIPPNGKAKFPKLIPNLCDKTKYIIHYRNLQQCLNYGLKLTKIHRALKFTQKPWLKQYIDLNTELRNTSSNEFARDFYKLMVNSIFGKTMENVENRVNIKLVSHWERNGHSFGAEHYVAKPQFKSATIFSENLVAIELGKTCIKYDRPVFVGFSILEIAKTVIYDFFYGFLKPLYGDNLRLLYTDTDSLIIYVKTDNFYEDIKKNLTNFDTSNYPFNNKFGLPITESVVGKFKDELKGEVIASFYGLCAKTYCVNVGNLIKKAKGVKKSSLHKQIDEEHYRQAVDDKIITFCKMYVFKSYLHTMYTELKNKVALNCVDDKRFIRNASETYAWGHYFIPVLEALKELEAQS